MIPPMSGRETSSQELSPARSLFQVIKRNRDFIGQATMMYLFMPVSRLTDFLGDDKLDYRKIIDPGKIILMSCLLIL